MKDGEGQRRSARGRTSVLLPWLIGTAIAGVVSMGLYVEAWTSRVEGLATDWLFRYGRIDPPRASASLAHVDIDEQSLATIGRWPWKREVQARLIRAIDACGAKVIALDLLYDDPDQYDPEQDRILADALREVKAKTYLAVDFPESRRIGPAWNGPEGQRQLREMMAALRANIGTSKDEVIAKAGIDGARARSVRENYNEFRRMAAESVGRELQKEGRLTEGALLDAMRPANGEAGEGFAGAALVREAARNLQAVKIVEGKYPASTGGVFREHEGMDAPLPILVEAADGIGSVTPAIDRDGAVRRVPPFRELRGRWYPVLGLAAAAGYLDYDMTQVSADEKEVRIGNRRIPAPGGQMLISWPRLQEGPGPAAMVREMVRPGSGGTERAMGVLRQDREDESTAGHGSAVAFIEWYDTRDEMQARIRTNKDRLDQLTGEILTKHLSDTKLKIEDWRNPERRAAVEKAIHEEAKFQLKSEENPLAKDPTTVVGGLALWEELMQVIPEAEATLKRDTDRLERIVKGKVVFLGFVATGSVVDTYSTSAAARTPGVVVNAMTANELLTGYAFVEAPGWVGMLITLGLGSLAAGAAGATAIGPRMGAVVMVSIGVAYTMVNAFVVFEWGHVVTALATPWAAIIASWGSATVVREVNLGREKAIITDQFGKRVHKRLFDHLMKNPHERDMTGVQKEITTLFADLANFTAISEAMDSRQTVAVLNRYMGGVNKLLTEHDAYVNKFLGDGVMAFWGALGGELNHAAQGCRAALACLERIEQLNLESVREGWPNLRMRIGISTGASTVGDCGAPPEFSDFTVIGDSVNLAARLETANKAFGTAILINGRTRQMLGEEFLCRPLGLVGVMGQARPTEVFELMAAGETGGKRDAELESLAEMTTTAVGLYRDRRLEESREAWRRLTAAHGESRLATVYLGEIERYLAHPEELFDGVIRLATK